MFYGFLVFVFVVVCILLIGIILVQSSKTGGMGTAMGGAAVQAAFGGHGADKLLTRLTVGLAVAFMVLAIGINLLGIPTDQTLSGGGSIISQKAQAEEGIGVPLDLEPAAIDLEEPAGDTDGE